MMINENLKNERIFENAWSEPTEIGGDNCVSKNFTRNYECHKDEPCSDCIAEWKKRIVEKSHQDGIKEGHRLAGAEYFKQVTGGKIKLEIVNENDPYWNEAKCILKPLFKLIKEYVTTGTIKKKGVEKLKW